MEADWLITEQDRRVLGEITTILERESCNQCAGRKIREQLQRAKSGYAWRWDHEIGAP